jgi:hypothetical protein
MKLMLCGDVVHYRQEFWFTYKEGQHIKNLLIKCVSEPKKTYPTFEFTLDNMKDLKKFLTEAIDFYEGELE